jgi:uncharacterized membrane protein
MPSRRRTRKIAEPHMPVRLARLHKRLLVSSAVGIAVLIATNATTWRLPTRLLSGWNVGVLCYLAWTFRVMGAASVDEIRRRAAIHDEGALIIPLLTAAAAIASLVAIVAELGRAATMGAWDDLALGMATIALSWLFMHTIFAVHYAHEYYGERRDAQIGGLTFPGSQEPDYWDFLYFSFVIAMTSQVSDVAITSKVIRRVVNVHGVLSFFFNVSVLALMVNMLSNLIR